MIVDVLVLGSGIAGCAAALTAAEGGLEVALVTKAPSLAECTATSWAQGGIIYKGEGDSPELLEEDILRAGAGIGNREAIRQLARLGPHYVESFLIEKLGVAFDRGPNDMLDITEEGAHSVRRIIHVADLTGRAIEERLVEAVLSKPNITVIPNATAIDLLTLSHHSTNPSDCYHPPTCVGAYVFLQDKGVVETLLARETILATGGLGQLFLHTTNPKGARGDGIAMAYRAGARLLNLEYVQFHPTALYHGDERFLISESVRGEGGVLIRRNGESFMERFHPLGSLAPRDVVARAIHTVMLEHQEPCVYLDITKKDPDWIRRRFPNIYAKCLSVGIDMTKEPIPVVPAAHYSCGGVAVDLQGRSSIRRLRAVGEVSCTGVHGANRLASTSLLEGLVWGIEAAKSIADEIQQNGRENYFFPQIEPWRYENEPVDPALIFQDWLTIKYTMWNYVGLIRTTKRMKRARSILRELQVEIEYFYERARLSDDIIGLRNGAQAALAVLFAALENRKSYGAHYRVD
ncbi:MAG: L-aspartate oxidase [Candidatus Sumerlaea chitinivorans]|nr:L-aspartate oxidase [Candidatus Sumerlaea chitinivorans]